MKRTLTLKTVNQINNIRESWKILTEILNKLMIEAKPWVTLLELEQFASKMLKNKNVTGAFKWYMWYPANLCLSVDDCVVHWIPDNYALHPWDLLKIDLWVNYKWWISDAAVSLVVWWNSTNQVATDLISATKTWIDSAILNIGPDSSMFLYADSIYTHIKNKWFEVIKCLTGHWVGNWVHELPYVYNRPYKDTKNEFFKKWMVLAIEPITAVVSTDVYSAKNWWNLYTNKWDYWAQWEYTLVVTDNWIEILAWVL